MAALSGIFGQDSAIKALRQALETDRLAGCYLIIGPQGTGKTGVATAFAQAASCLNPATSPFDACGICESCRLAAKGGQPEIVTIVPAGELLQIWQFWDRDGGKGPSALSHTLQYAPSIGRRRVYIIESAESLTPSAANSLLKSLEEPPPYALFVLLATHQARLLPTILSRSQTLRLKAAPEQELAGFLRTSYNVEAKHALTIAAYTEGRVGAAVRLAQEPGAETEIDRVLDFAESIALAPGVRALRVAEQIRKLAGQVRALVGEESVDQPGEETGPSPRERTSRRQLGVVFDLLIGFYRDLLALRLGGHAEERIVNRSRALNWRETAAAGDPQRWMACIEALASARKRLDVYANIPLLTEALAIRLLVW